MTEFGIIITLSDSLVGDWAGFVIEEIKETGLQEIQINENVGVVTGVGDEEVFNKLQGVRHVLHVEKEGYCDTQLS